MNPVQSAGKSAKNLAQQIAKQIAQEPIEVLKSARAQVSGENLPHDQPKMESTDQKQVVDQKQESNDKIKSSRRMEALNRELDDIRKQDVFKDLQRRISEGEQIPLEDYPELSLEQKQVLKAQMEAVRIQAENSKMETGGLVEPAAKKGRQLFNFGKKTGVKREQTHVEKINPPSG